MKTTGVVRKLDDLGRIVIPIEIRKTLGIALRDAVEISVEEDKIVLQKAGQSCIFCNSHRELVPYHDKLVCQHCLDELRQNP